MSSSRSRPLPPQIYIEPTTPQSPSHPSHSHSHSHSYSKSPTHPSSQSAIFQHSPSPTTHLQREWEPGCQPDEVYDRVLPPWRAALRRWLVRRMREEKDWMASWQVRIRTPRRDGYFYWTAIFGTHFFFMTFLPMFFFFGYPEKARGLLYVVGLGIYVSSFAKDLACTPRPYSPPVVRLTMSTHHHEYGFPSSHSTNSFSIALYLAEWLWEGKQHIGINPVVTLWTVLAIYVASVVGGRVYTGMHSIADVVGGSLMGIACWVLWTVIGTSTEAWVNMGTLQVPAITIPLTLALVHFHPEPVDDCPCFEDAIAILSVILGSFVGHWYTSTSGPVHDWIPQSVWAHGVGTGFVLAVMRVVIGIGMILAWRIFAKAVLLRALPPVFRAASRVFDMELPTRKFYKAATDYQDVPTSNILSIPSFIDLHSPRDENASTDNTPEASGTTSPISDLHHGHLSRSESPVTLLPLGPSGMRKRKENKPNGQTRQNGIDRHEDNNEASHTRGQDIQRLDEYVWVSKRKRKSRAERAKYDADVLTKVGVYSGIGVLATTTIPWIFAKHEGSAVSAFTKVITEVAEAVGIAWSG